MRGNPQDCGVQSAARCKGRDNCEYGAFDNRHEILPRVSVDLEIDQEESAHPGQQTYEKMIAGMYLGEILRLLLVSLHQTVGLFAGWDIRRLRQQNTMDSESLSKMEADGDEEHRIDEGKGQKEAVSTTRT
ncbi:hexokinase-domain-containing protein [Aspergillus aurantiobrunneus]